MHNLQQCITKIDGTKIDDTEDLDLGFSHADVQSNRI